MRCGIKLLLPLLLFLPYGCIATQQDMLKVQGQMDNLSENILAMQRNQADLAVKMEELSRDLNVSSENMKDISSQMLRLSEQLENLDAAMNRRVNAIGQSLKKQQESVENALMPSKAYNEAYAAFQQGKFNEAAAGFKQYIVDFPKGDLIEGAYFFLGEALYLKTEWPQAAWSYAAMLEKFPKSGRTAAARLKYAQCLLKMPKPKTEEAVKYLKSVLRDYPTSPEAETAKVQLNKYAPKKPKTQKPKSSKSQATKAAKPAAAAKPAQDKGAQEKPNKND